VRWRQALPALADLGLDAETLLRFSRRAGRADAALTHYAREAFARAGTIGGFGEVELALDPLAGLPEEVSLRVLGEAIAIAGGGRNRFALGPLERLLGEVFSGAARRGQTLCGCKVSFSGDRLIFTREASRIDPEPVEIPPEGSALWDQRFVIGARTPLEGAVALPARAMTRDQAELLLDQAVRTSMAAVRAAPLVVSLSGKPLALGTHVFDSSVSVRLAEAS
jgi:tRNA(Ile)-lysidine synthase